MSRFLVTGCAGFIGMHTARALLEQGHDVVGIDNINDYYSQQLKHDRLATLECSPNFTFHHIDVADLPSLERLFKNSFDAVIHLAAQAGVRYSITNPHAYAQSNLVGFLNILECCRHSETKHLVYASSSSVYGGNVKMPFAESDPVDHPVSLYAATKKSNELMAHTYSHLYGLPTTGLRFFTVYGPWGRPDMAPMLFSKAILAGEPIKVFNHGNMQRDFTYVDDIVRGVIAVANKAPQPRPNVNRDSLAGDASWAPYQVFNIGSSSPIKLLDFIATLENALGEKAILEMHPMAPGDVEATYAEMQKLENWTGVKPQVSLEEGIHQFANWYRSYFNC